MIKRKLTGRHINPCKTKKAEVFRLSETSVALVLEVLLKFAFVFHILQNILVNITIKSM